MDEFFEILGFLAIIGGSIFFNVKKSLKKGQSASSDDSNEEFEDNFSEDQWNEEIVPQSHLNGNFPVSETFEEGLANNSSEPVKNTANFPNVFLKNKNNEKNEKKIKENNSIDIAKNQKGKVFDLRKAVVFSEIIKPPKGLEY